jgi:hypothetical protein
MPQEVAKLMSELSASRDPERRFELIQELYVLLSEEGHPKRGAGPLEFMAVQGQW